MTSDIGGFSLRARRGLVLVLVGFLAVGALAACADSSTSDEDRSGVPTRTVGPGQPISDEQIGHFNVGIMGKIPQLDPADSIESGYTVNMNVLEPLLRVDSEGKIQPWLATGFEAVSDTVYEYDLREGVEFWDGTELTSEDVKYTWEREIELDTRAGFASVDSIEALDKYTVRVTLAKPDASWKYTPTLFYSVIYQKDFAEEAGDRFGQPGTLVMGTGPWEVESLNPTSGMELSAFAGYWGGKPPIEQVSVKFFADDNSMALAMRAGEIDFAQAIASPKAFDAAAGGGTVTTVPMCATALVSMPTRVAPWDDVHVRRAVAYALDRHDIIAATQGRAAAPTNTLTSPMMLQPMGTEDEVQAALDSVPSYPHDVEKAKAELAKSKVPEGFSTELKVATGNSAIAEVIADQMSEIGIKAEVVAMQDTAWHAEIGSDTPPFTFTETGACTPDPSWNDIYLAADDSGEPIGINIAQYAPSEVRDLLTKGLTTQEPKKRLEIYTDVLKRLGEDVPYVPAYAEGATYASNDYDVAEYGSYVLNFPWLLNVVPK